MKAFTWHYLVTAKVTYISWKTKTIFFFQNHNRCTVDEACTTKPQTTWQNAMSWTQRRLRKRDYGLNPYKKTILSPQITKKSCLNFETAKKFLGFKRSFSFKFSQDNFSVLLLIFFFVAYTCDSFIWDANNNGLPVFNDSTGKILSSFHFHFAFSFSAFGSIVNILCYIT